MPKLVELQGHPLVITYSQRLLNLRWEVVKFWGEGGQREIQKKIRVEPLY